ncbi:MAG: sugar ABC transporter permease [Provencibacterium sp.]|jgi:putative aldouronate transport system permease protein|nr:sugar ABC transporter permease [Provencibacterium sp.]
MTQAQPTIHTPASRRRHKLRMITRNGMLYLFLLPALLYILLFQYVPLYGIQIAFKDFVAIEGIWNSPWVGFKHFSAFFSSYRFWDLIRNTLTLSLYRIAIGFPMPILLALLLNYTTFRRLGKFAQTATYAPHFISVVVMVGMLLLFLSPSNGVINKLLGFIGIDPVFFMGEAGYFKHIYVWSGIWQTTGWSSIIYIAALTSVSPELHEAAVIDGANKLERIWHIDVPSILPTAIILLVMDVGRVMNVGFEKVLLMQNDLNLPASEIISTYTYKVGLLNAQYSYSTAIGLFNNIINFILLISVNKLAKRISGTGLW